MSIAYLEIISFIQASLNRPTQTIVEHENFPGM